MAKTLEDFVKSLNKIDIQMMETCVHEFINMYKNDSSSGNFEWESFDTLKECEYWENVFVRSHREPEDVLAGALISDVIVCWKEINKNAK